MSLLRLFLIFVKIGAILLGGGYVIFPIMQSEFVEKRKYITQDDLVEYFAISQSLPGIIAANMSMFIGYKLCGKMGALSAMLGIIFVPFICIVFLASLLNMFINSSIIQGLMWGVGIAVIALILLTARDVWQKADRNCYFYIIFLASLAALLIFKLSPIVVIIVFSIVGTVIRQLRRNMK